MKRLILSLLLTACITGMATAQNIRFNVYSAYVCNDNVDSYYDANNYYNGTIEGGYQWGGGLEYMVGPTKGIELKYLRRDATAPMEYYINSVKNKTFDLAMNHILLGGSNYFKTGDKVEPYAGFGAGVSIINVKNPDDNGDGNMTKFAWTVKLGANIWINEKVGLKLQADLLSVVQSAGGSVYFGTGGSGAGVGLYSTMYQWAFGGGLTFKLGN